jgi:hypothetical protein
MAKKDSYGMPSSTTQRPNYVKRITSQTGMGKVELHNTYAQNQIEDYIKRIQRNSDAMTSKSKKKNPKSTNKTKHRK